jgi:hypothetical protein
MSSPSQQAHRNLDANREGQFMRGFGERQKGRPPCRTKDSIPSYLVRSTPSLPNDERFLARTNCAKSVGQKCWDLRLARFLPSVFSNPCQPRCSHPARSQSLAYRFELCMALRMRKSRLISEPRLVFSQVARSNHLNSRAVHPSLTPTFACLRSERSRM